MNFTKYITVTNGTTRATAIKTTMQLMRGTITAVTFMQQSGTANTTSLLVQHQGLQVFPTIPESYLMPVSAPQTFNDFIPLDQVNPVIDVLAWNSDAANTVIGVTVTVIAPEDLDKLTGQTRNAPGT